MKMEDEEFSPYAGYGSGCGIHGEDFLRECTMCGIEFCAACFPNSTLCSDCAAQAEIDDHDEVEPSEDDKDLLLLESFNDDESAEGSEAVLSPLPPPAKKIPVAPKAIPLAQAKVKAPSKPKPTVKVKSKAKAKPKPKAKTRPKVKAKPKAKSRTKAKARKKR